MSCVSTGDFGFARFLEDGVMAATLCGSPMYMVNSQFVTISNTAVIYVMRSRMSSLGCL